MLSRYWGTFRAATRSGLSSLHAQFQYLYEKIKDKYSRAAHSEQTVQPPSTPVAPEHSVPHSQTTGGNGAGQVTSDPNKFDRDLVRWTRAVAILTGFLFVAALLQFGAALLQWHEMRVSGIDTGNLSESTSNLSQAAVREAASMKDLAASNKAQMGTLQGQLDFLQQSNRAFVSVPEPILFTTIVNNTDQNRISFIFQNNGSTPTRNLVLKARCVVQRSPKDPPFEFRKGDVIRSSISARETINQGKCSISHDEMVQYANEKVYFFAIAEADYGDIGNPRPTHKTEMCLSFRGRAAPITRAGANPDAVWLICNRHNCADDECKR